MCSWYWQVSLQLIIQCWFEHIRNLNCSRQLYSEHLLLVLVVNSFSVSSNWIFLLTAVLSKLWTGVLAIETVVLLAVKLYTCGGRGHVEHLKIVTPTKCLAFAVLINCVGVAHSYPTFFSWAPVIIYNKLITIVRTRGKAIIGMALQAIMKIDLGSCANIHFNQVSTFSRV